MKRIAVLILIGYSLVAGAAYLFQEQILFPGASLSSYRREEIKDQYPAVEEITVKPEEEVELHGWFVPQSTSGKEPLLIYFGGNAEEVSWLIEERDRFEDYSLLLVNYRGYGLSDGQPGEEELFNDAVFLYDEFAGREVVDEDKIAVKGRSLGTGIAAHVAYNREVERVVLVSPYDSITNVGQSSFPFLPVRLLLKHRFDAASKAAEIKDPMLALVAEEDGIVPPRFSRSLFQEWAGEKDWQEIEGRGHNDIQESEKFWRSIENFLEAGN